MRKLIVFVVTVASLVLLSTQECIKCNEKCPTKDCINHDISQQTKCHEVSFSKPTRDCRWPAGGLSHTTDQEVFEGKIVAYQIQWFYGGWSGWYVPGVNDVDCKYNKFSSCKGCQDSLRRMWSYFYDHNFKYIICPAKNQVPVTKAPIINKEIFNKEKLFVENDIKQK